MRKIHLRARDSLGTHTHTIAQHSMLNDCECCGWRFAMKTKHVPQSHHQVNNS